jgi:hypothetical protein
MPRGPPSGEAFPRLPGRGLQPAETRRLTIPGRSRPSGRDKNAADSGFRPLDSLEPAPTMNVLLSRLHATGAVMANDDIPGPDGDFHAGQDNFVSYVNAHLADLGLPAGDVAPLNAAQATWTTDYPGHTAAAAADIAPAGRRTVATGEAPPAQRAKRNPWEMSRVLDSAPTGRRRRPARRRIADRQRFLRPTGARRTSIPATAGLPLTPPVLRRGVKGAARPARRDRLPLTGRSERSSRPRSGLLRHVKGGARRRARRWGRRTGSAGETV